MQKSDYVALHLHSEYSLLDGAIRIDELIDKAKSYGMPAVAVTDHGNLFGAVEFYKKAKAAGIKPIIGCEVYIAPKSRFDKSKSEEESSYHLIVLAKDNEGYRNLVALVTKAYIEGFYYRPRIDMELLREHSKGLIALTSCMKGEIPYLLERGLDEKARETALRYADIMGKENFFIELQENGLPAQNELNKKLLSLARQTGLQVVATSDCHYLNKEDARAHEILLCIQTGRTMKDPRRMRFESDGFYFKSPEEMARAFSDLPEAVLNTRVIAEQCSVEFNLKGFHLPKFEPPDGLTAYEYIERIVRDSLREKFGPDVPPEYLERASYELSIIKKMGYESYFLIVWDLIKNARLKGIPVGPGRGSAAGSLISYALGITEIDPLKYGLLFERFLNPDRISMPDIDIDFCKDRRPEVISYVAEKYGSGHVAQIITFGTMAARAAIRDVARALDYPYAEADKLAKLVPDTLKITLNDALNAEPALKELYDTDPKVREIIDVAKRLEGLARHASTHAAGVVIAPVPLIEIAPLYKNPQDNSITTQFDMGSVEALGLIKFDLLGLKTLTIIDKTVRYIREKLPDFTIEGIPLDDAKTYELLGQGSTTGVFQLESSGMRGILVKMQPNRFEDLIALVALYRPGPIGSGMIDDFIKRKKGLTPVRYMLPELKEILDETYGVILYQEQVMSIANKIAGFTMAQADALRKAMGKKLPEVMAKYKETFIEGALLKGIQRKKAEELFDLMAKFAEYGFNKSHSAAYALIAYRTAYLKAHYPVEFMAATLSADLDNTDKIAKSIKECQGMGIKILPPDVNACAMEFHIDGGSIRFGLGAVKGVGAQAVEAIVEARREGGAFKSLGDFIRRVDQKRVNKKALEALAKAGAFDSIMGSDGSLYSIARCRHQALRELDSGSTTSLGLFAPVEDAQGFDEAEVLKNEKEALGFYITANPMAKYREQLRTINVTPTSHLEEDLVDRREVEVAGIINAIKKLRTKDKGDIMAYVTIEDEEGSIETIVFPELLKNRSEVIKKDNAIVVRGTIDRTENGTKLIAKDIMSIEDRARIRANGRKVEISINIGKDQDEAIHLLRNLKGIINPGSGGSPLYIRLRFDSNEEAIILAAGGVKIDPMLISRVEGILGKDAVRII